MQNHYTPSAVRLTDINFETPDTATLTFSGSPQFKNFEPGQFNMILVPGIGEVPISISGDPSKPEVLVHTIRHVGSVTAKILGTKIGSDLGFRGPYGQSWPMKQCSGRDIVLVAGGIGLAPLRPVIYSILNNRSAYNKVSILYGARSRKDLLFQDELRLWLARSDIDLEISVDKDDPVWEGHVGVITRFIPGIDVDPNNSIAMICGPEIMMRYSIRELQNLGFNDSSIFVSMERNMRCGIGHCGHCQYGGFFVCKDGPVFAFDTVKDLFAVKEV